MQLPFVKALSLAMLGRRGGLKRPFLPEPTEKPVETAAGKRPRFSTAYLSKETVGTVLSLSRKIGRETALLKLALLKDPWERELSLVGEVQMATQQATTHQWRQQLQSLT